MADKTLFDKSQEDRMTREKVVLAVLASGLEEDRRFPWNKARQVINYIETGNPDGSATKK